MALLENADSLGLDHMRAFIAVIETGSQVRAAKRLRMTQTTVGRHVARVQEHFGGRLFAAGGSGPLSSRGALVEQAFRATLAELGRTRERLAQERPVLRVGFIRAVRPLVERALRDQQRSSAFDIRLAELTSEAQARALQRGELDIAISYALPELARRDGIEESAISEQPYALVVPERAWVKGRASRRVLASLVHAHSPRRNAQSIVQASERWLRAQGIAPRHTLEVELGADVLAYAGAGYGFGFLPALWSMASHDGVVFAPVEGFGATAKIAAYSLQHVTPLIAKLRHDLSTAARTALRELNSPG